MAKKKKAAAKRKTATKTKKKKPAKKKVPKKKAVKKKSAAKKKTRQKAAGKKVPVRKKAGKEKKTKKKSLGRGRIPGTSKVDLLFHKDFQARELCEFLRVETLKDLEEFTPDEIVERMTRPFVQTVNRIRKMLALNNRSLKDDQEFAREFQKSFSPQSGRQKN